jgi:hypothetical protein
LASAAVSNSSTLYEDIIVSQFSSISLQTAYNSTYIQATMEYHLPQFTFHPLILSGCENETENQLHIGETSLTLYYFNILCRRISI